jgi:hypothetical protein
MTQRFFLTIGWIGFLLFAVVVGFGFLIEKPYLQYTNLPFPVMNTEPIKPGATVYLQVARCNADSIRRTYIVSRTLIPLDSSLQEYVLPAGAASIAPGCHVDISAVNVRPDKVLPGRYYIEGAAEVNGFIRTFVVRWTSQPFEVHN